MTTSEFLKYIADNEIFVSGFAFGMVFCTFISFFSLGAEFFVKKIKLLNQRKDK